MKDVSVMSVTTFSGSPSKAMRDAERQPIMVVSHHRPVAYVLSVAQWTAMVEKLRQLEPDPFED
jgi:prevent-host-death family protein